MTKAECDATESVLRVHAEYIEELRTDFFAAGNPTPEESERRREETGELRPNGLREAAPKWWQ